jgi:phosphatidate cytidylyltransferase
MNVFGEMLMNTSKLNRPIPAIPYTPYHIHLLMMACFASLVAPFGGFFASGFKRAFDLKQCLFQQSSRRLTTYRRFLMGIFTYVYYSSLIREHHVTVGSILQTIVSGLTVEEQLELIADLRRYLGKQGIAVP